MIDFDLQGPVTFEEAEQTARDMPRLRDFDALLIMSNGAGYGLQRTDDLPFILTAGQLKHYWNKCGWAWREWRAVGDLRLMVRNRAITMLTDCRRLHLRSGRHILLASGHTTRPRLYGAGT